MNEEKVLSFYGSEYVRDIMALMRGRALIDGNNALKLEPIEPQLDVEEDSGRALPIREKEENLADKVRRAAVQLKAHYDYAAEHDPLEFAPYWNGETTFTAEVNKLPKITRRRLFESYEDYFMRNCYGERASLSRIMDRYFSAFFEEKYIPLESILYIPTKWAPLRFGMHFARTKDEEFEEMLCVTLRPLLQVSSFGVFGTSLYATLLFGDLINYVLCAIAATTIIPLSYCCGVFDQHAFKKLAHDQLVSKAKRTDEVISLIKSLAE